MMMFLSISFCARNRGLALSLVIKNLDVYYYFGWRKLEGETENMGVCTKERKGVAAEVLMATPCTNSLGGESRGHKHEGCGAGFAGILAWGSLALAKLGFR